MIQAVGPIVPASIIADAKLATPLRCKQVSVRASTDPRPSQARFLMSINEIDATAIASMDDQRDRNIRPNRAFPYRPSLGCLADVGSISLCGNPR